MELDDDDFGDEFGDVVDLDDLPADALDEIEERAIASTQAARNNALQHHVQDDDMLLDDDDDVINLDAPQRPSFVRPQIPQQIDEVTAREQWRQSRYSAPSRAQNESSDNWHNVTYSQAQAGPGQHHSQVNNQNFKAEQSQLDVGALQARIAELEQQQLQVQKSAEDARAAYMSKAGEIAIVRANHDKAAKEYERRLAVMQQLHAEEVGKQKAELERMRRDRDKVETDNRFLQHDLAQEAEKAKTTKRTVVARQETRPSPTATPRKDKSLAHRDGFDDDEVMIISPSKRKEKTKPSTPKGTKRKRVAPDMDQSPGLPMIMDEMPVRDADVTSPVKQPMPVPASASASESQYSHAKFKTVQMVLAYRPFGGPKPVMEILSAMFLPGSSRSIASNINDELALLPADQSDDDFRLSLCISIASQWSASLKENYHDSISYLCDLLMYILLDSVEALSTQLMGHIAPLCLATIDLIAVPTARAVQTAKSKTPEDAPSEQLKLLIDPLDYLDLLQLFTVNCLSDDEALASFWSILQYDFVLVMLHRAQPLEQIMQMLQLLSTSILPGSFGAIAGPRSSDATPTASSVLSPRQPANEAALIDRLTVLLFETPASLLAEANNNANSTSTIAKTILVLRTQVLTLLTQLAASTYGGKLLATHRTAFGRLVRFLHDAILAMYDFFPEAIPDTAPSQDSPALGEAPFKTSHDHYTNHVNLTVLLLATLTDVPLPSPTDPSTTTRMDVRSKLSAVPGGIAEKHLISLSRIAFADGLTAIERGIDGDAADAAHRMLDELLSPEEGESVVEVFGGSAG